MSAPTSPSEKPTELNLITVLPALTVLAVVLLFGMQAMRVPAGSPPHADTAHIELAPADPAHGTQAPNKPSSHSELPILGQIQPFSLLERNGKPLTEAELMGKVWVADFIFTTCQAECPLMSAEMQKLQTAFSTAPELRLVSFSVDPETDTPATLTDYAKRYQADAQRWLFVTGNREVLYKVATESFMLPVQDLRGDHAHDQAHDQAQTKSDDKSHEKSHEETHSKSPDKAASSPFLHSQKFALVDGQMQIRGYYDSTDPQAMQKLIEKDLPQLLTSR